MIFSVFPVDEGGRLLMITGIDLDLESDADGNRMLGELYPISDVVPGIKKVRGTRREHRRGCPYSQSYGSRHSLGISHP